MSCVTIILLLDEFMTFCLTFCRLWRRVLWESPGRIIQVTILCNNCLLLFLRVIKFSPILRFLDESQTVMDENKRESPSRSSSSSSSSSDSGSSSSGNIHIIL